MPRKARKKSCTGIYHVVIRGADHQLLFEEHKDYLKYLEILNYYKEICSFELYAYCLMANHVHLLINVGDCPLESIFRRINSYYAGWFNRKYNRTGYLQQGRYYSEPVEDIQYLLNVVKYIHYNPSKAGLESSPGTSYPWNSYTEYISSSNPLINPHPIIKFYNGIDNFISHHANSTCEACLDINILKKRLPDDVAKDIIKEECNCKTITEFQTLSLCDRNKYLHTLYKKGISIRQLNRLTGIPKGIIERVLAN